MALVIAVLGGCVTSPSSHSTFILPSKNDQVLLGEQAYRYVNNRLAPSANDHWKGILNRAGHRLADVAVQADWDWQFSLVESREVGGFCFAGGKVVVQTGLMLAAGTEATLAGVLGHLCAHAIAGHFAQRIAIAFGPQLDGGGLPGILEGADSREQRLLLGALGWSSAAQPSFPFSETQEIEADALGISLSARAGYDPRAVLAFWEKADLGRAPAGLWASHPRSAGRAAVWPKQLQRALSEYRHSPQFGNGEKL
jgi:predicted Zn-dependent protease